MSLQLEDGQFTRIVNEALEQIVMTPLPPLELRIVFFIIRKTWGYQKKADIISLTQFEKGLLASRPAIVHSLKNLVLRNIIVKTPLLGNKISYSFNKYYDKWVVKTPKLVKYTNNLSKDALTETSNDALTHKRKKEIIQKKTIAAEPPEVNQLLDYFKKTVNEHINFGNKTERKACTDLLNAYGLDRVKTSLAFLEEKRKTDKYLPLITTPYELWTKWAKIKQHLTAKKGKIWKTTSALRPFQQEAKSNLPSLTTTTS